MIKISNVTKSFGNIKILDNVCLEIPDGSIYGIVGRSGAGKSTLLRCINGLENFECGKIYVNENMTTTSNDKLSRMFRKEIGMVFQNFSLLNRLNVFENIALPMKCWGYKKKEINERVNKLLKLVSLSDKASSYSSMLSGGEKQRVAIARALAMQPKVILCDEATSALDPNTTDSILSLLKYINEKTGITIIIVAHQLSIVSKVCSHMAILENGKVAVSGSTYKIFTDEPPAFCRLRGDLLYPENLCGVYFRIVLSGKDTSLPILTYLSKELNVDFMVLKTDYNYNNEETIITYVINVSKEYCNKVQEWLVKNRIKFYIIKNKMEGNIDV